MSFRKKLQQWFSTSGKGRRVPTPLSMEALEERLALTTYTVDTYEDIVNPSDSLLSLREAIIAANASDSEEDTIVLGGNAQAYELTLYGSGEDGALTGDLDIRRDTATNGKLTIIGTVDNVTIDGTVVGKDPLNDRIFEVTNGPNGTAEVLFQNITITGGTAHDEGAVGYDGYDVAWGGGILNNGGDIELNNVTLLDNEAAAYFGEDAWGGGLASYDGSVKLIDVTFQGNIARAGNELTSSGSFVSGAGYAFGGGMYVESSDVLIEGSSTWNANTATGGSGSNSVGDAFGGAIYSYQSNLSLPEEFSASENIARGGTGMQVQGGNAFGGAIAVQYASFTLATGASLSGNSAIGGDGINSSGGSANGGGLYFESDTELQFVTLAAGALITGNSATGGSVLNLGPNGGSAFGGGVALNYYGEEPAAAILDARFICNAANGGSGLTNGGSANGGGAYVFQFTATFTGARFISNTANGGSGPANGSAVGGGVQMQNGTAVFSDVLLKGNLAQGNGEALGGGIYTRNVQLELAGVIVRSNSANSNNGSDAYGGGLASVGQSVKLTDVTFACNQANGGSEASSTYGESYYSGSAFGGGMYVEEVLLTIEGSSTWTLNQANGGSGDESAGDAWGGAIAAFNTNVSLPTEFSASKNSATGGNRSYDGDAGTAFGGAIAVQRGSFTMAGGSISGNTAAGGNANPSDSSGVNGGTAHGGGVYVGALYDFMNTVNIAAGVTISNNNAFGGNGSPGGDGPQPGSGGAAYGGGLALLLESEGGTRNATVNATVSGNSAHGGNGGDSSSGYYEAGSAYGGGAYVFGFELTIDGGTYTGNSATSSGGGDAHGGGLATVDAIATLNDVTFLGNEALGYDEEPSGDYSSTAGSAYGGGAYFLGTAVTMTGSSNWSNNAAYGGDGGYSYDGDPAGDAAGGAIYATGKGLAITLPDGFYATNNTARGGDSVFQSTYGYELVGGSGEAYGGAIFVYGMDLTIGNNASLEGNFAIGGNGTGAGVNGGDAWGGGLSAQYGSVTLGSNVTFSGNQALGGQASDGEEYISFGEGGWRFIVGSGGNAYGGGLFLADTSTNEWLNFQLLNNLAQGGNGGNGATDSSGSHTGSFGGHGGNAQGGGAYLDYASLSITQGTITGNMAYGGDGGDSADGSYSTPGAAGGSGGDGVGGGLFIIEGSLSVMQSVLSNNHARGGDGGAGADGGYASYGGSGAFGGEGGSGGHGVGGGLYVIDGSVSMIQSVLSDNHALGGDGGLGGNAGQATQYSEGSFIDAGHGGNGGDADGGGLYLDYGSLYVLETTVANNTAIGGHGSAGGDAIPNLQGPAFTAGNGGSGGDAYGAGMSVFAFDGEGGAAEIYRSTFSGNQAQGGNGGDAGAGTSTYGYPTFGSSAIAFRTGGNGGFAQGGGLWLDSATVLIANSTYSDNSVTGGNGGNAAIVPPLEDCGCGTISNLAGAGGNGEGGGIYMPGAQPGFAAMLVIEEENYYPGEVRFEHLTVAFNTATGGTAGSGGENGVDGYAGEGIGGGANVFDVDVLYSIFSNNTGSYAPDFSGYLYTSSQNLFLSSEGVNGDLSDSYVGIDPLLGALQYNGSGYTQTRALGVGSLAIDTATLSGYINDQRNSFRPVDGNGDGFAFNDIGAFEAPPFVEPNIPDEEIPTDEPYNPPNDLSIDPNGPALVPVVEYPPQIPLPVVYNPAPPKLEAKLGTQTPDNPIKVSVIRVFRIVKIDGKPIRQLITTILAKDMDAASVRAILVNKQPGVYQITMSLDLAEFLVWEGEIPLQTVSSLDAALDKVYNALQDRTDPLKHLREVLEGTRHGNPAPVAPPVQSPAVTDPTSAAGTLEPDWVSQADRFWQDLPATAWEQLDAPLQLNRWQELAHLRSAAGKLDLPSAN